MGTVIAPYSELLFIRMYKGSWCAIASHFELIETNMVEWPQNHRKTIETNGLGAGNHLMVMVEWPQNNRKTIESNGQWAENH